MAQVYESIAHDESDVVFGIDLRKWADAAYWAVTSPPAGERKEEIPPVLASLLGALLEAYPKLPNDMGTCWLVHGAVVVAMLIGASREAQDLDLRSPASCGPSPAGDP